MLFGSKKERIGIDDKLKFLKNYKENKEKLILKEKEIKELVIAYGISAQEIEYLKEKEEFNNFIIPEKILTELEEKIEVAKIELYYGYLLEQGESPLFLLKIQRRVKTKRSFIRYS